MNDTAVEQTWNIRGELLGKTIALEVNKTDRIIDIMVDGTKRIEVKCWKNFYKKTFLTQFIKDLKAVNKLEDLEWIFDAKMDFNLKDEVIAVLKSAEGSELLNSLSKSKKTLLFKNFDDLVGISEENIKQFMTDYFAIIFK